MAELQYLDATRVTATKRTVPPRNPSRTGYGPKLPTSWLLLLDGKRWHRVYVMQWSNSGTAYVLVRGEQLIISSTYELEQRPRMYGPERA